jgi:hypothetical protein
MVTCPEPAGNPEPAATGLLTAVQHDQNMAAQQVHAGGPRLQPATRGRLVVVVWAQLPVRAAVAPEGAFSAQTPPARPFS